MENNMKYTLVISKINEEIAKTNIELSKDKENLKLKDTLLTLLKDKEAVYSGSTKELKKLFEKYGVND